jgi:DNA repair exonuclease SbcCD ATPase subunit
MSKQDDDLDDQLHILLASMKEYREAIADDNKRLEAFYSQVASGVLDKAEKALQETNKQALGALKNRIQELDKATNRLNWQFIALYSSAFVALVMIVFLAIFLFIPSIDEIQQRRADVAWLEQKYSLDIKNCNSKACVRIMKNDCHGTNKDYCVIDPK